MEAREALILGSPPRILPLRSDAVSEEGIAVTRRIRAAAGSATPVTASTIPELVLTVLKHADLFECIAKVSAQLQAHGLLPPRLRQLAVLRTTWLCQAPYAWGEHVRHSKRIGITSEEIERVTDGASAPGWDELDRACLRAVDELHDAAMISDETWQSLKQYCSDNQLFELTVLVGQFTLIAYFQNSLRMRLSEGTLGLRAR